MYFHKALIKLIYASHFKMHLDTKAEIVKKLTIFAPDGLQLNRLLK